VAGYQIGKPIKLVAYKSVICILSPSRVRNTILSANAGFKVKVKLYQLCIKLSSTCVERCLSINKLTHRSASATSTLWRVR